MRLLFLLCCPSTKAMRVPRSMALQKPLSFNDLVENYIFLTRKACLLSAKKRAQMAQTRRHNLSPIGAKDKAHFPPLKEKQSIQHRKKVSTFTLNTVYT